jgi:hypothetical protein
MVNHDPYSDETQIHQVGMSKVARRVLQSCGAKIVLVEVDAINRIVMSEKPRVLQSVRYTRYGRRHEAPRITLQARAPSEPSSRLISGPAIT